MRRMEGVVRELVWCVWIKFGSEIMDSHDLQTDLNRTNEVAGVQDSILNISSSDK